MPLRRRLSTLALALLLGAFLAACAQLLAVGRDFPSPGRETIRNGTTTKADLLRLFGEPVQMGIKDGDTTWTWYVFRKGERDFTKQLEVTFTPAGVVKSYSFSSNFPEDMKALR
jgi:outer membrane protein assembly factor BamE (lipoprotein component of BamABCDE complex)